MLAVPFCTISVWTSALGCMPSRCNAVAVGGDIVEKEIYPCQFVGFGDSFIAICEGVGVAFVIVWRNFHRLGAGLRDQPARL